jgi:hydrogenase expression/formation protein HypC
MCVGIPAQIIECDEISAMVDITGTRREISMMTLEDPAAAKPGDWVLVHAGYAVTLMDEEHAKETLQLMIDMAESE